MQKNRVMLVADDIDVNRASFRAMFEEEYEVLEAGDGNETLKILEERKVDIVILDMCMPVKSGKQVLKQMKADPKLLDIPVIVKTVIGEERELEMLEMGADDFVFDTRLGRSFRLRVEKMLRRERADETYLNNKARENQFKERLESQRHLSTVREHLLFQVARTVRTDVAVIEECYREMTGQRTENKSVGLEDMYRHLEHIRELTDSVLDGQIVGVGESVCDTFQISDVVAELTSECRTICTEMGIEVTVQEGEIFCEYLVGDVRRLKQIWARLLKKAYINARPGCRIFTGYREVRTGEDELELELAVQGSIDGGEDYPLIKSLVELLHGTMCVEVREDAQILCRVFLPFRIGKAIGQPKSFAGLKTLLLDDNELSRDYHAAVLARLGLPVDVVQNGADAVAYLRRAASKGTAYDLCFVNWYMQGGEPFIRSVRENFPKGSLTICCSTNEKELVECQMLAAGVDCVVERPIYQEGMYRFLTELCRQESGKNGTGSEKI